MTRQRVANIMLKDIPWDNTELAAPLTLPGALLAPSYVEQAQIVKPANPPAGSMRFYPKSDGQYYKLDSAGTETIMGGLTLAQADARYLTKAQADTLYQPIGASSGITMPLTQNLTFSPDNTYDIGASGASRPRDIYTAGNLYTDWIRSAAPSLNLAGGTNIQFWTAGGNRWAMTNTYLSPIGDGVYDLGLAGGWYLRQVYTKALTTSILQSPSHTIEQRNGTNPQTLSIYNTYTDASNWERLSLDWTANNLYIRTAQMGTGVARNLQLIGAGALYLGAGGTQQWVVVGSGILFPIADNTIDFGLSNQRPRTIYAGTSFVGPGAIPTGGTTGQVLAKNTATNYDVGWTAAGTGGGGGSNSVAVYEAQGVTASTVTLPVVPASILDVSVNGQSLMATRDYTVSSSVITFTTALTADDVHVEYMVSPFNYQAYSAHFETTLSVGQSTITLPTIVTGIPLVTRSGVVQYQSAGHYSISGVILTLSAAIQASEDGRISVDYVAGGSATPQAAVTEEFKPAAAATTVTLSKTPADVIMVTRDGAVQSRTDGHYSFAGSVVTFTDAFNGSERVLITYVVGAVGAVGAMGPSASLHEEFMPAAAASTLTLSQVPQSILMVARNGVVQSASSGNYSFAGTVLTFTDTFSGTERVVVEYAVQTVVPPTSYNGAGITDGSIATSKLAGYPWRGTDIVDLSIATADLADGAVTNAKLAANSVSNANIIDGTILAADIADAQITTAKLAASAIHGIWVLQLAPLGNTTSTTAVPMPSGFGTGLTLTGYTGGPLLIQGMIQLYHSVVGVLSTVHIYIGGVDQNLRFGACSSPIAGGNFLVPILATVTLAAGSPVIQLYWSTNSGTLNSQTGYYQWLYVQELRR